MGVEQMKENDDLWRLLKQNVCAKQLSSCSMLHGWGRSWASEENTQQVLQSSETKARQGRSWPSNLLLEVQATCMFHGERPSRGLPPMHCEHVRM